jgi:hypothetical protein
MYALLQAACAWLSPARINSLALLAPAESARARACNARTAGVIGGILGALLSMPALATPVSNLPLDFSSISLSGNHGTLGAVAGPTAIQNAINSQLPSGDSVRVTGGVATKSYNGEGHVVGNTLSATAPGGIFVINDSFGVYSGSPHDYFTIQLNGFSLSSIEFDYEIFPDASCPLSSYINSCYVRGPNYPGNTSWPDIEISINGANTTPVWTALAPKVQGEDPQALVLGQVVNFPTAANSITFWDWPATIGIADLRLNVPEPGTLALLAGGLAGLWTVRRRARSLL